jgi:iron complex transport system permease protein
VTATITDGPSVLARPRRRKIVGLALTGGVVLAMCAASLAIGTEDVSLPVVWQAITNYHDVGNQWVVHELRIPRTALALVVGVALGLSGAVIQAVARNPLADTGVLGINSGAGLFVVTAIALLGLQGVWAYVWFGFLGALVAMVLVYLIGWSGRASGDPVRVLLAGVAVGAVMDGISFTVRLRHPRAFDNMRFWDTGALDGRSLVVTATIAPFIVVGVVLCVVISRSLNATSLGDELGAALGGNVIRVQVMSLVAVTILAGAATAGAGPIGFVGLMVPHLVRRFVGPDWRWIMAYSTLAAPALLLAADVLGRVVVRPAELPAGIVTAFLGAPVLIWVVRRRGAWQR